MAQICRGANGRPTGYFARQGLRAGPGIDLKCRKHWDVPKSRLVEWLLWLIWQRRTKATVSEGPCASFSIARQPRLRPGEQPWDFDPA